MSKVQGVRFTLVEMLVVTSIITLLASMLLPALGLGLVKARMAACENNLKQLTMCMVEYTENYADRLPLGQNNSSDLVDSIYVVYGSVYQLHGKLWEAGIIKSPELLYDPGEGTRNLTAGGYTWSPPTANGTVRSAYQVRPNWTQTSSQDYWLWGSGNATPANYALVRQVDRLAIMADSVQTMASITTRHRRAVNVSFFDCSVQQITLGDITSLIGNPQYLPNASPWYQPLLLWQKFDTYH